MIFEAESKTAAESVVNQDPAIIAGVFRATVQAYRIALFRSE